MTQPVPGSRPMKAFGASGSRPPGRAWTRDTTEDKTLCVEGKGLVDADGNYVTVSRLRGL